MGQTREPFYVEFGRRVREERERRKWSQEALGQALPTRLTRASIANIEAGQQRVLAHTLVELARVLDVSVKDLVPSETRLPADERKRLTTELAQKVDLPADTVRSIVSRIPSGRGEG